MTSADLLLFRELSTAHVADACMRLGLPVRCAPAALRPVIPGSHLVGRVLPARHTGSVDVFLEAFESSEPRDVLVVDNRGRLDEACVGDLVTHEAANLGLAGILIWGLHRDTGELHAIGLPVYSLGSIPTGPSRADPSPADALHAAQVGDHLLTEADFVHADDDGALFLPLNRADRIAEVAAAIRDTERRQATAMADGTSLRQQLRFTDYLERRARTGLTFREHLSHIGAAIEE